MFMAWLSVISSRVQWLLDQTAIDRDAVLDTLLISATCELHKKIR